MRTEWSQGKLESLLKSFFSVRGKSFWIRGDLVEQVTGVTGPELSTLWPEG